LLKNKDNLSVSVILIIKLSVYGAAQNDAQQEKSVTLLRFFLLF